MIHKLRLKYRENIKDKDFGEIYKGSILTFIAKIFGVILGFVFSLLLSKYYGAEGIGIFALITTYLAITLIPSLLGTDTAILRFIPEHNSKYSMYSSFALFKKVVILVTVISFLVSLISYFGANIIATEIFNKIELLDLIILSSFFIVIKSILALNISAIRALKSINIFVLFQILNPTLNIIILLILTYFYFNLNNPAYIIFYTTGITFLISIYFINKLFREKLNKSKIIIENIEYKSIISTSFPMFLTSIMGIILTQTDILMLGVYTSTQEVGIYAVVIKFALLTTFILTSINTIVAPKFAELYHSDQLDILEKVVKKSSKMIFFSTLPIIIGLLLFGKYMLSIFGEEFILGYTALIILAIGQFVNSSVGSVGYLMNMSGYQKEFNYIMIVSAILNIVLNMILIPKYGLSGAAFASACSLILWNLASLIFVKIKLNFYTGYLPLWMK